MMTRYRQAMIALQRAIDGDVEYARRFVALEALELGGAPAERLLHAVAWGNGTFSLDVGASVMAGTAWVITRIVVRPADARIMRISVGYKNLVEQCSPADLETAVLGELAEQHQRVELDLRLARPTNAQDLAFQVWGFER